jgi:hypothetical protein
MAKFNFRQGIARAQTDSTGNLSFLKKHGQYLDLIVQPNPTVFVIAQSDYNYMFTENVTVPNAWGPFNVNVNYWLYWDIDLITSKLTRKFTKLPPFTDSVAPMRPKEDQHWFDTSEMVMKVWNGAAWIGKLRVFAAEYQNGASIIYYPLGSQCGIGGGSKEYSSGSLVYDTNNNPAIISERIGNCFNSRFVTTETSLHAQFSKLANFRMESSISQAKAYENIPENYAVAYVGPNTIGLASCTDHKREAIGISSENISRGEVRSFTTKGFVRNEQWNFTEDAGHKLYVGMGGLIETKPIPKQSIQEIGIIIDPQTIYVNPRRMKYYNAGSVKSGNYVLTYVDVETGEDVIWDTGILPGAFKVLGYVHNQIVPANIWNVKYSGNAYHVMVQVFNEDNEIIMPFTVRHLSTAFSNPTQFSANPTPASTNIEIHFSDPNLDSNTNIKKPELKGKALISLFVQN